MTDPTRTAISSPTQPQARKEKSQGGNSSHPKDGAEVEVIDGQYRIVTEKDGRCAYLFDPENGYVKQMIEGDAVVLNERVSGE